MREKNFSLPSQQIARQIANYTIGFAKLDEDNVGPNASSVGTGTLACLGKVYGIVTAAHVLDALPKTGPVGIVRYHTSEMHFEKQTIEMLGATKVTIGGPTYDAEGPDLGFLRLPPDAIGWLKAINSFYDLRSSRDKFVSGTITAKTTIDAVAGMISDLTTDQPPSQKGERRKRFKAIFANGELTSIGPYHGHELMEFVQTRYKEGVPPERFGGTSGGAIWRFFIDMVDGQPGVVARQHWGIPFYEHWRPGKTPILVCHGPDSIYGALFDAICKQWPEEVV